MKFHRRNFKEMDAHNRAKILKGSIIPRPIAWITTRNEDGSVNLAPFSYFNMVHSSLMSVSFRRDGHEMKDTIRNILRTKKAVVHIADKTLASSVDLSSKTLAYGDSEVILTGMALLDGGLSDTDYPALRDAKIRIEVSLFQHMELPNYEGDEIESDFVLLRAEDAYLRDDVFDEIRDYVDHKALDPLARLGGPYFATITELEGFERSF